MLRSLQYVTLIPPPMVVRCLPIAYKRAMSDSSSQGRRDNIALNPLPGITMIPDVLDEQQDWIHMERRVREWNTNAHRNFLHAPMYGDAFVHFYNHVDIEGEKVINLRSYNNTHGLDDNERRLDVSAYRHAIRVSLIDLATVDSRPLFRTPLISLPDHVADPTSMASASIENKNTDNHVGDGHKAGHNASRWTAVPYHIVFRVFAGEMPYMMHRILRRISFPLRMFTYTSGNEDYECFRPYLHRVAWLYCSFNGVTPPLDPPPSVLGQLKHPGDIKFIVTMPLVSHANVLFRNRKSGKTKRCELPISSALISRRDALEDWDMKFLPHNPANEAPIFITVYLTNSPAHRERGFAPGTELQPTSEDRNRFTDAQLRGISMDFFFEQRRYAKRILPVSWKGRRKNN